MKKIEYKEGDVLGGSTYIREADSPNGRRYALFKCHCGFEYAGDITGVSRSTGCVKCRSKTVGKANTKHGEAHKSKEYKLWCAIKDRCFNPKCKEYSFYGGRGIIMDKDWEKDFPAFLEHIGRAPTPQHSIDRIENEKGYEYGNLRWATKKEQARNRRSTISVNINGKLVTVVELAEQHNIRYETLRNRLKKWTIAQSLNTPIKIGNNQTTRK